jgi:formylglycine-generating enzyme required for sulfatase activity
MRKERKMGFAKTIALAAAFASAHCALAADPLVSAVKLDYDENTGIVTVGYTLENASAIIAVDILTNGVSIGADKLLEAYDGTNSTVSVLAQNQKVVAPGSYEIQWLPRTDKFGFSSANAAAKVRAWKLSDPPEIMMVDLERKNAVSYYASTNDLPYGSDVTGKVYLTSKMLFRRIPARGAKWRMGTPEGSTTYNADTALHETCRYVTMLRDYYMGIFPVTLAQLRYFYSNNASETAWNTKDGYELFPATCLSTAMLRGSSGSNDAWPVNRYDGAKNSSAIGKFRLLTGIKADLPTEEQWEYACRAGTGESFNNGGEDSNSLKLVGWYNGCAGGRPHRPGELAPNAFGLYDMHGNVFEQVLTRFRNVASSDGDESDGPADAVASEVFVIRGGCWNYGLTSAGSGSARSIAVTGWNNQSGFRLYCPVPAE